MGSPVLVVSTLVLLAVIRLRARRHYLEERKAPELKIEEVDPSHPKKDLPVIADSRPLASSLERISVEAEINSPPARAKENLETDFSSAFKAIRSALGREEESFEAFDTANLLEPLVRASTLTPGSELLVVNEEDVSRSITLNELGSARVIRFLDCTRCSFVLPKDLIALTKVFVKGCANLKLTIECRLITRHLEIERCENIEVVLRTPTDTLQVDLSKEVRIFCDKDSCRKVYHAGVQQLSVCAEDTQTCVTHDYLFPDDPIDLQHGPSAERQFVTEIIGHKLKTQRVRYRPGGLIPDREVDVCYLNENES